MLPRPTDVSGFASEAALETIVFTGACSASVPECHVFSAVDKG